MNPPMGIRTTLGVGALALGVGLTACSSTTPPRASLPSDAGPGAITASPTEPARPDADATGYRDGEYSARGWYGSLPSHHDVTLTISNDAVTAVEISTPAENETSLGYQQRFADALPGTIVGRSLDDIEVDALAGSSGCSEGFMDALRQIKEDAAA